MSEVREANGVKRVRGGKGRFDLLPMCGLRRVAKRFEWSLEDHEERNWEAGMKTSWTMDSALRHITDYLDGDNSEDHLAAAVTNLLMNMFTEEKHPECIDIPARQALGEAMRRFVNGYTEPPLTVAEVADALAKASSAAGRSIGGRFA